ncbi:peptidoglycan-binding protein [Streptomyces sp. NPDC050803]|uniref:peptidoglycan-binding protein n=1 Tax=unclassified Streptomyces TaxID=2593676 RepID=UPI0034248BA4
MTDPKGHQCPECGAPRGADNTPSCACTQRASEALRDARTAEAAAAEDFDPLRIRPYVELEGAPADDPAPDDTTMPLSLAPDVHLFEAPRAPEPEPEPARQPQAPRGRRRRTALLGAAGAVVAVVAAAGMASGLFSYETPTRDTALPDDVRASVPDDTTSEPASMAEPSADRTSASPSPSATTSPSPSATRTSASPSPSESATPSPTQSATTARASDSPAPQTGAPSTATVLRRGDHGAEVTELQLRLGQLYLYNDDAHGNFNRQVEEALKNYQWSRGVGLDNLGVYDAQTRASLESETSEP